MPPPPPSPGGGDVRLTVSGGGGGLVFKPMESAPIHKPAGNICKHLEASGMWQQPSTSIQELPTIS